MKTIFDPRYQKLIKRIKAQRLASGISQKVITMDDHRDKSIDSMVLTTLRLEGLTAGVGEENRFEASNLGS